MPLCGILHPVEDHGLDRNASCLLRSLMNRMDGSSTQSRRSTRVLPGLVEEELHVHTRTHLRSTQVLGALNIFLGLCALVFPLLEGLAPHSILGAILASSGLMSIVYVTRLPRRGSWRVSLSSGIVTFLASIGFLFHPTEAVLSLGMLSAGFFVAQGVVRSWTAFRAWPAEATKWLVSTALVPLLAGALIILRFREASAAQLAPIFALDLTLHGFAILGFVRFALAFGRERSRPSARPRAATPVPFERRNPD